MGLFGMLRGRGILLLIEKKLDTASRAQKVCLKPLTSENSFRVGGKHVFPGHILASDEAKKLDQNKGIPDEGAMKAGGLYRLFPFQVIHDGFHQHPDVFISHVRPPEEFVP